VTNASDDVSERKLRGIKRAISIHIFKWRREKAKENFESELGKPEKERKICIGERKQHESSM
jgi:hypothetical protein